MTSRQIPTQHCKSILSTLPLYFLLVVSARVKSVVGALTELMGGLTSPAAPIVLPLVVLPMAASVLLARWIYDVNERSYVFPAMPC